MELARIYETSFKVRPPRTVDHLGTSGIIYEPPFEWMGSEEISIVGYNLTTANYIKSLKEKLNKNASGTLHMNQPSQNKESFKSISFVQPQETRNQSSNNRKKTVSPQKGNFSGVELYYLQSDTIARTKSRSKSNGRPFQKSKVLVLDLDHTLIYPDKDGHGKLMVKVKDNYHEVPGKDIHTFYNIILRPNLQEFIDQMSKLYKLCIYSSNDADYTDRVLKAIFKRKHFDQILSKENMDKNGAKILTGFGVEMNDILLIDDEKIQKKYMPQNVLTIKPYKGAQDDTELTNLIPFLTRLATEDDVRPVGALYNDYVANGVLPSQRNSSLLPIGKSTSEKQVTSKSTGDTRTEVEKAPKKTTKEPTDIVGDEADEKPLIKLSYLIRKEITMFNVIKDKMGLRENWQEESSSEKQYNKSRTFPTKNFADMLLLDKQMSNTSTIF